MAEHRKQHDHERQQFDASVQRAKQELAGKASEEGAAAGLPGFLAGIWGAIAAKLSDPAFVEWLWGQLHGGGTTEPTPQPPAPPPEPAS